LGDAERLAQLEPVLFGAEGWSQAAVAEELRGPGRHYVVAELGGEVLGYAGIALATTAEVMTVGVIATARGQGLGRRLTEDLVQAARQAGSTEVFLEVRVDNDPAIELYRSMGFAAIDIRRRYYSSDGTDAVVMRKDLGAAPDPADTTQVAAGEGDR
jgi:ribosomal-protein-alanine acetyltransferase